MLRWKIKICGIKNVHDALAAIEFGADAIGLNFYARSLRSVTPEEAAAIISEVASAVTTVGVFVNESAEQINRIRESMNLNAVQLHGDENPALLSNIYGPVIRAIRIANGQFDDVSAKIEMWEAAGAQAVLLDSGSRTQFGGTGNQLNWESVAQIECELPVILAGGLTCDNVAQAIETAGPAAVDVASGIEKFPGVKDHPSMKKFIESATDAFASA